MLDSNSNLFDNIDGMGSILSFDSIYMDMSLANDLESRIIYFIVDIYPFVLLCFKNVNRNATS